MTTTTVLATWALAFQGSSPDPRHDVITALGEFADDYDTDALTRAWVDALDDVLPDELTLASNGEVYGPSDWTGNAGQVLRDAVNGDDGVGGVDFWALAARYDRTLSAE